MFFRFFLSFVSRFYISLLSEMSYNYDPFFTRETPTSENNSLMTPFFTLFVLSRAFDNTSLLLKIFGRRMHGPSPTSHLLGDRPPSPPRSPPMGVATN